MPSLVKPARYFGKSSTKFGNQPAALAAWILEDRIPARMQMQMHKQIWPGIFRGV